MKIVVIGGTGLIGSKLVKKLREQGHEAIAAAPNTGVNSLTGEGLAEALKGAAVVVDVSNSRLWEDSAVMKFFETSTRNLLSYEGTAKVGHHIALSVVGTDRLSESGYFRAKIAQEELIEASPIPYSIVHATQFFEFLKGLADISSDGDKVRLPHALFQPMAADDVADGVARIAVAPPVNGIVEIGGPEQFYVDDLVRRRLATLEDSREVIADPKELYDGAKISERTLLPGKDAQLGQDAFRNLAQTIRTACRLTTTIHSGGQTRGLSMTFTKLILALACLMSATLVAQEANVKHLMSKDLTDLPNKEGVMITVEYPPGASDPIHRHNAHAFVYVLEGSVVMQVRGGKEVTLTPGQTFYEGPDDVHIVGRNASKTKPAKFVVFLVKNKGAPLLVPAK